MAILTGHGVQNQKPTALPTRFLLGPRHQGGACAMAARRSMHQQFHDVGAVRLIGRRIEAELHCPDNPVVELCCEQHGIA